MFLNTQTSGFNFSTEFVETTSEIVEVQTSWIKRPRECINSEMGKRS
jgi:hypothetical protein